MPAISTCPRCQRQVSIPTGVDPTAAVRCPLCEAEYPLSDALALAPPELVPLFTASSGESATEGYNVQDSTAAAESGAEPETEEHNEAIVGERIPAGVVAAQFRSRNKSSLGKFIGLIVGGLAGCAVAYLFLLPLLLSWVSPANKGEKARNKPAVERTIKPEGGANP